MVIVCRPIYNTLTQFEIAQLHNNNNDNNNIDTQHTSRVFVLYVQYPGSIDLPTYLSAAVCAT